MVLPQPQQLLPEVALLRVRGAHGRGARAARAGHFARKSQGKGEPRAYARTHATQTQTRNHDFPVGTIPPTSDIFKLEYSENYIFKR